MNYQKCTLRKRISLYKMFITTKIMTQYGNFHNPTCKTQKCNKTQEYLMVISVFKAIYNITIIIII